MKRAVPFMAGFIPGFLAGVMLIGWWEWKFPPPLTRCRNCDRGESR